MRTELAGQTWPPRRLALDVALAFGVYAVLAYLAIVVGRAPGTIAAIWFANGAATGLIVTAPRAHALPMLVAGAGANLLANLAYGDSLLISAAFVPPNLLEVVLAVRLLRRMRQLPLFSADHVAFLRVLVAGSLVPPVLGATIGAATLDALEFAPFARVWSDWYIGAALGSVAMLPLVLALRAGRGAAAVGRLLASDATLVLLGVAVVVFASVRLTPYPFVVIGVVLMAVAFVRPRLTTFACIPVVVGALAVAVAFRWYLPLTVDSPFGHALVYLSFLLVTVPAQLVSVTLARQRAVADMLAVVGSRTDEIVVFADMDGICRWANRAREAYWSVSNETLLGRPWSQSMAPDTYERFIQPMFEQARGGQVARRVMEFDYPARGKRTVATVMQPAYDEEGYQVGVLCSAADITEIEASGRELQRLTDQLTASNQSLEQFVRIASHDLREPLNTIVQFCDLIDQRSDTSFDATTALYFAQVRKGAARMKLMLDDVLQFVQLDERPERPPEIVSLDEVAKEVLADLSSRIASAGATVTCQPLGEVTGYRSLLSVLLQNLVSNAIKFVAPSRKAHVDIRTSIADGYLWLTVADNGIGIDAAKLPDLGTPFRRLHARRKFEGTGLGLAICRRIAEQHAGRIAIESTPNVGSKFSLVVPAS